MHDTKTPFLSANEADALVAAVVGQTSDPAEAEPFDDAELARLLSRTEQEALADAQQELLELKARLRAVKAALKQVTPLADPNQGAPAEEPHQIVWREVKRALKHLKAECGRMIAHAENHIHTLNFLLAHQLNDQAGHAELWTLLFTSAPDSTRAERDAAAQQWLMAQIPPANFTLTAIKAEKAEAKRIKTIMRSAPEYSASGERLYRCQEEFDRDCKMPVLVSPSVSEMLREVRPKTAAASSC